MTNKLTLEVARRDIGHLKSYPSRSLREELYLQALEIALPVLEQQDKGHPRADVISTPQHVLDEKWNSHFGTPPQPLTSTNPQIDNDSWIEWKGDEECPVPDGAKVDIKFRDGDVFFGEDSSWDWSWDEDDQGGADIIAYRVIENDGREG